MRQRRELDAKMEAEAVGYVRTWLASHGLDEYVEHKSVLLPFGYTPKL